MDEEKPQERKLLRTEVTPTGVIVEYWSNERGGEDVVAHLPMISSQTEAEDFAKAER